MNDNARLVRDGEEVSHDERFRTRDTQLAAVLLVLGFELSPQPFTTLLNPANPKASVTSIWFKPSNGVDHATQIKRRFEMDWHDQMPHLSWMKCGFNERRWFVKEVVHGNFPTQGSSPLKAWYKTDSLLIAATLKACGSRFVGYRDQRFYFSNPQADAARAARAIHEGTTSRERWTFAGLEQQQILIDVIRGPEGRVGKQCTATGPFGTAYMNAKMSEEQRRAFLFQIHNKR